ncbi:MAG: carboxylating nicotinate-nucleotide diphosphorylase [Verrucomicrobiae bacterium]|nr:carboxylating nicotinate-nucleotide diphosphorylase [Verrucomicrobiae bacterium]NNJ42217.1 carboxylating nicotinate-nucleotide diphosphorylase [Akkermansiaceae bacterium]
MDEICDVVSELIDLALREDIGSGDVTSLYFVPEDRVSHSSIHAKAPGVIAGMAVAMEVFRRVDPGLQMKQLLKDGDEVKPGDHVLEIGGSARSILTAERVVLNFLQRLSGVATQARQFVARVEGTKAKVLDTRKTTPGWRALEKMAVAAGGGTNHRMGLYDRAMVKDNHLVTQNKLEVLQAAIHRLNADQPDVKIELEADTLEQVEDFLKLSGVDFILLDNMSNETMKRAVAMRGESGPLLEASGGVNLNTVAGIAQTGVDFISVGALTHSVMALDLSLEIH